MKLQEILKKSFNIQEGEFRIAFLMQLYVFMIITSLLIIKPTVNSLFLSELGVESLPVAFLWVALIAYLSSYLYSRALNRFSLLSVVKTTLSITIVILSLLVLLLKFELLNAWMLFFFYVWVAIHAVLSASQFWVLANLVFNPREAKRLFGFIGSGAILGGIFGGYLTSILAPIIGNNNVFILAIVILFLCIPLLGTIWRLRVEKLNLFKVKKRTDLDSDRPLKLIRKSRHLTFLASILGISVIVAKLVDYQFSDFASAAIPDPDDLTSFFAFWFSTFNLLSLSIQLFVTHRVVGVWGVGSSMLILPMGILVGSVLFFFFPELALIVFVKAVDGSFKQSINKSAMELLALPLPFELKNKTKTYIDVVVDSVATGIAGFILIFFVRGLSAPSVYITGIIILLLILWVYFVFKVRQEYFQTFRDNLAMVLETKSPSKKLNVKQHSVVDGMKKVFEKGSESQILFMLGKLREINDPRFFPQVQKLLSHPSVKVRTAAVQSLYFLNVHTMVTEIPLLLASGDEDLITATLEYVLLHSSSEKSQVFDQFLDHQDPKISRAALFCLARESRDNNSLRTHYRVAERIEQLIKKAENQKDDVELTHAALKIAGVANLQEFYPFLSEALKSPDKGIQKEAIEATGLSLYPPFIKELLPFLSEKNMRPSVIEAFLAYGQYLAPYLIRIIQDREAPIEQCRLIPLVLKRMPSQQTVSTLMLLLDDQDVTIRQEAIRALSDLKRDYPQYRFDHLKVVRNILEECRMYHQSLSALHTQIIISYRNRTKSRQVVSDDERNARSSLLELLERRLDAGLERIFKLLGLRFGTRDIDIAYEGILSEKQDAQSRAIEYLDNLLYGDLRRKLMPIIENTILDVSSEEVQQTLLSKVPTEYECFHTLLHANDHKIKLAVLYLIGEQKNPRYQPLVEMMLEHEDERLRDFASQVLEKLKSSQ